MSAQDPFVPPAQPQEWLSPARLPNIGYAQTGSPREIPPPMYELRPLTTSEVLDRTFAVYRSKFWLFAGIASFTAAMQSMMGAIQMAIQARHFPQIRQPHPANPFALPPGTGATLVLALVAGFLMFLAAGVIMAACVFAVGETYLGRATTIKQSFAATIHRWYAYIGIAFWQLGSFMWPTLVLAVPGFALLAFGIARGGVVTPAIGGVLLGLGFTVGMVVGIILGLRNAFGVPIAVLERMKVRAAMRRSKMLTKGTKWKIILIGLITYALLMVVGILQMPLAFISAMALMKGGHAYVTQALTLVISFVGYTVVTPVALIGNSLLYFDQRVRKEAFDIAFLLGEERALESNAVPHQQAGDVQQGPTQAVDASPL